MAFSHILELARVSPRCEAPRPYWRQISRKSFLNESKMTVSESSASSQKGKEEDGLDSSNIVLCLKPSIKAPVVLINIHKSRTADDCAVLVTSLDTL